MNALLFSIVIPTYNRARTLGRAIESVLGQTENNWELIVIDDGSTDETRTVVERFDDARIRYLHQQNQERSASRNRGVRESKGSWICFLDSDDVFHPDHLASFQKYIGDHQLKTGMCVSGLEVRHEGGGLQQYPLLNMSAPNLLKEIWTTFVVPDQVCISRDILIGNPFDERFRIWEDTHLWLRIAAAHPVYQLPGYTSLQFVHSGSSVQQSLNVVKLKDVRMYVQAIDDLYQNHQEIIRPFLSQADILMYKDSKYRMFLYQARCNRQFRVSLSVWYMGMMNKPSVYLVLELMKIPWMLFGIRSRT
ncbi:MAG: glycosyltransferase family 2 protein [Flavobacteriales bacterium]|nr:glycosyltransferase family 2 protein [Flavobacteriales bacterium]